MASARLITRRRVLESVPALAAAAALATAAQAAHEPEPSPFQGDGLYTIKTATYDRMVFIDQLPRQPWDDVAQYKVSFSPQDRAGEGTMKMPEYSLPHLAPVLVPAGSVSAAVAEDPHSRCARLAAELSDALNEFWGGTFYATVMPSRGGDPDMLFSSITLGERRSA